MIGVQQIVADLDIQTGGTLFPSSERMCQTWFQHLYTGFFHIHCTDMQTFQLCHQWLKEKNVVPEYSLPIGGKVPSFWVRSDVECNKAISSTNYVFTNIYDEEAVFQMRRCQYAEKTIEDIRELFPMFN